MLKNMMLPTLAEIRKAQKIVYGSMNATAQYIWPLLKERLRIGTVRTGGNVDAFLFAKVLAGEFRQL